VILQEAFGHECMASTCNLHIKAANERKRSNYHVISTLAHALCCADDGERQPGLSSSAAADGEACHPAYPALRRAQRLSFAIMAVLVDTISPSEGRQAFIEAGSTTARLRMALARICHHRRVMQAVAAMEDL
jgi:hypothetical protein